MFEKHLLIHGNGCLGGCGGGGGVELEESQVFFTLVPGAKQFKTS